MIEIKNIIIAAIVGSVFTLIIQWLVNRRNKKDVIKAIRTFLHDVIKPSGELINKEIEIVEDAIYKYDSQDLSLDVHPRFNPKIINSFSIKMLQTVFKDKLIHIINIVGLLEYLQKRLPFASFELYVEKIDKHIDEHFNDKKDLFSTEQDHFNECTEVAKIKKRYIENLRSLKVALSQLQREIDLLDIYYCNKHSFFYYIFQFIKLRS